jgi:PRTRC genetic system protein B
MMKLEVSNEGDSYELTAAVLIYTNKQQHHAFATKHSVEGFAGRPIIRPGTPFTNQDYAALVKALAPADQPKMQWNDPRLLARGLGRMVWWSPPKKRSLFFKKSTYNNNTFDGRGVCACPGLVFMVLERSLYLFAFKGEQAPTKETKLYQAPFFNVWSRGEVCVGNADRPRDDQREDLDAWERMFFGSHFTHPNFAQKDRLTVGVNPIGFWQAQLAKPSATFPEKVLYDLQLTVSDLLSVELQQKLAALPVAQGEF